MTVSDDAGTVGTFTVEPLGPGQVDTVDFSCQDSTQMSATADSTGRALESDETNNDRSVSGSFSCLT